MRVTNEQVKWLKENDSLEDIRNIASDLLEARKLIWEMRQGLAYINSLNIDPMTSALSNTARCGFSSKKTKELLEKSKDYAN